MMFQAPFDLRRHQSGGERGLRAGSGTGRVARRRSRSARFRTWWHWLNGNIMKDGIEAVIPARRNRRNPAQRDR